MSDTNSAASRTHDEQINKDELLHEVHMLRLENIRLNEQLADSQQESSDMRQLKYLEHTALIDLTIRQTTDLEEMMNSLMSVIKDIFQCNQAWLLHPCDPEAPSWRVPFRSTDAEHPIKFGPHDNLPSTPDLAANCRLALNSPAPIPLGPKNLVKNVPVEAQKEAAKSALLIALHPKVGRPWLMGLHQCTDARVWTPEEKRMFKDISSRIADALSATLFYRNMEENQDRLKHLSTQLFRAQEEERKLIAEEIHDELGQATLAIIMGIENALFTMGEDAPEDATRPLQSASNLASGMVQKMRGMQTSLYPPTLRDFGTIGALNGFLKDYVNIYNGIIVKKDIHIKENDIPTQLRVTIFRIAQEALYNAAKHSQADTVTVELDRINDQLSLRISDNGTGFDPATTIRYPDTRLGLGLTGMRERTEMTDGIFQIQSTLNEGTTILAIWDSLKD